ncbi:MAG: DUF1189 domain-containing protein [Bacillota bacterium]
MNFFRQMKDSVTDFRFYKGIKENRFGKTFLYLLILFLIIHSINTVQNYIIARNLLEMMSVELNERVPEFQVIEGQLNFEGDMPYYILNEQGQVFVVDTTGQLDKNALEDAFSGMLFTKDRIYIKNQFQYTDVSYTDMGLSSYTKKDLVDMLPGLSSLVLVFMIIGFVFAIGIKLLQAVLLGLVGLIFGAAYNVELKFKHTFNFGVYALTLPMLLQIAYDLSGYTLPPVWIVPLFTLIYWGVALVYMAMAVKYYKNSLLNEPREDMIDTIE